MSPQAKKTFRFQKYIIYKFQNVATHRSKLTSGKTAILKLLLAVIRPRILDLTFTNQPFVRGDVKICINDLLAAQRSKLHKTTIARMRSVTPFVITKNFFPRHYGPEQPKSTDYISFKRPLMTNERSGATLTNCLKCKVRHVRDDVRLLNHD